MNEIDRLVIGVGLFAVFLITAFIASRLSKIKSEEEDVQFIEFTHPQNIRNIQREFNVSEEFAKSFYWSSSCGGWWEELSCLVLMESRVDWSRETSNRFNEIFKVPLQPFFGMSVEKKAEVIGRGLISINGDLEKLKDSIVLFGITSRMPCCRAWAKEINSRQYRGGYIAYNPKQKSELK